MSIKLETQSKLVSEASARFLKMAQLPTLQFSQDPMSAALQKLVGKTLSELAGKYLNEGAVSSVQVNVNWQPPSATFTIFATGSGAEAAQVEMANVLNAKFATAAAAIMGRYQKTPLDYKLATYEK